MVVLVFEHVGSIFVRCQSKRLISSQQLLLTVVWNLQPFDWHFEICSCSLSRDLHQRFRIPSSAKQHIIRILFERERDDCFMTKHFHIEMLLIKQMFFESCLDWSRGSYGSCGSSHYFLRFDFADRQFTPPLVSWFIARQERCRTIIPSLVPLEVVLVVGRESGEPLPKQRWVVRDWSRHSHANRRAMPFCSGSSPGVGHLHRKKRIL
jgi:hypothetical protein